MDQKKFDTVNDRMVKKALQSIAEQMNFSYEDVVKMALHEYISRNEKRVDINIYNHSYLTGKTEEEIKNELQLRINDIEDLELFEILTKQYQDSALSDDHYDSAYLPEDTDVHFIEKFIQAYQMRKESPQIAL